MEQQEALEQIKLIRDTMQKASQKFFFSPRQWIEWGFVVKEKQNQKSEV